MQNNTQDTILVATPILPSVGWSARTLRIGRVQLEFVSIHDTAGAYNFGEFVSTTLEGTKRKRAGRTATRYLEHLPNNVPARLLSEETADYLKDMERRELSRTALSCQRHHFRLLLLATGDIPVSRITCDHIRDFWDVMRWWPKNAGSQKRFEGLTDPEILQAGKDENREPPAHATLNLAQRQIAAFFNRLLKKRVIASSPLDGFGEIKKSLVQPETRRAFSGAELSAIFSQESFVPWANRFPHAWWAPLIGLYTGARVGEIAQLKVADVFQEHGVWCFHFRITPDANGAITQSLKGASSIRIVPVAKQLIDAGFLDFMGDVREGGHPRLFPQLKLGVSKATGKNNGVSYGAGMSQQFASFLRKKHPNIEKGLAFHGLRHTMITYLGINKVPVDLIASITGHDDDDRRSFPVLEKHYLHLPSAQLRKDQLAALDGFNPPVSLPKYVKGQFAKRFGPNAKKYP
jgi:integrase